jgi:cytochrome c-type biogenesis protein CcmE
MATGIRLAIGMAFMLGLTAYLIYLGSSSSWQYYLTVDECLADASSLSNRPVRVSGDVVARSLRNAENGRNAVFLLAGTTGHLTVHCSSPLPDQLVDGRPVVVEGRLGVGGVIVSDKVLTRCASKYSSEPSS